MPTATAPRVAHHGGCVDAVVAEGLDEGEGGGEADGDVRHGGVVAGVEGEQGEHTGG